MKQSLHMQLLRFHELSGQPIKHRPEIPSADRIKLRLKLIAEEFFELLAACEIHPVLVVDAAHEPGFEWNLSELVNNAIENDFIDPNVVNLPKFMDALGDMDYVNEGTRLEFGVDGSSVAEEIHRANLRKFPKCDICEGSGRHRIERTREDGMRHFEVADCLACEGRGALRLTREDGKLLKPPGWTPPNIEHILLEQGWKP